MTELVRKRSTEFPGSIPWYFFPWYNKHPQKKFVTLNHSVALELGGLLPQVTVAYETYGTLNSQRDNVILVQHALTGDSHVARHGEDDSDAGWWDELVGPGKLLDTDRYYVICSNVLGGCQGTTGPYSLNPETGKPYGSDFPTITIRDMVHVQHALLEHLKIRRLVAVVGGSMGGMQTLEWAVSYPDMMDYCVVIAAPGKSSAQSMAYNMIGRQAIVNDPQWLGGHYYHTAGPVTGLGLARMLGMITYQSDQSMEAKFGRIQPADSNLFCIQQYLHYQADKLVERFDANSYLCFLDSLDNYDLGNGYPSFEHALSRISSKVFVVGVSSDILYPVYQQKDLVAAMQQVGVDAEYLEIQSSHGHDGFLIDFPILESLLRPIFHCIGNCHKPQQTKAERPIVQYCKRLARHCPQSLIAESYGL